MLNGMFTEKVLESLHVHKAFLGIPGIHAKIDLMNPKAKLVSTKQFMILAADEVIAQEVVVTPEITSICHVDLRYFTGNRRPEVLAKKLPMALLHEGIVR